MSIARAQVYAFAERLARNADEHGIPYNGRPIEPGSQDDDRLRDLLDRVEDDRAHREAEKLRKEADELHQTEPGFVHALRVGADMIDPYTQTDAGLVRKSDGKTILL